MLDISDIWVVVFFSLLASDVVMKSIKIERRGAFTRAAHVEPRIGLLAMKELNWGAISVLEPGAAC